MSIKFENVVTPSPEQWEAIIIGARNPMNSWERSDSFTCETCKNNIPGYDITMKEECGSCCSWNNKYVSDGTLKLGPNDLDLMKRLRNAGTDHRKFMRMVSVIVTITAPLYWWKEFDTYKVGTVANSCSTMHKIAAKEFTLEDFSYEHLMSTEENGVSGEAIALATLQGVIMALNFYRDKYLETKDKKYWWQMIQLLPTSYNQKRTVMMNYEVLANIYKSRKNHKLDEWAGKDCFKDLARDCNTCVKQSSIECRNGKEGGFIQWIESLPYSELITGEFKEEK